ncbi:MAG: ABC transporter substrate-binding protein [Nitrososphaerales archaeon]
MSHNSNYTQWTFNVKPGLMWSNGQPVTSQDILNTYSPSYALNPNYDLLNLHSEIVGEHAFNTSAAVYVLNQSDAHLADKMSQFIEYAIEPSSDTAQGPAYNMFGTDVADGPFHITDYTSGSTTLVMLRNPYYKPLPTICEIDVNFVENSAFATQFLVSGQTDYTEPVAPGSIAPLLNLPNIHLYDEKAQQQASLQYNVTSYPYNMTQFRQALAYSINYSAIVQQAFAGYGFNGGADPGGVPPNFPWYNPHIQNYTYDPVKAASLLQSIGLIKGSDGNLHYPNGTAVTATIWTISGAAPDVVASTIMSQDFGNIGIQTNVQTVQQGQISANFPSNAFNIQNAMIFYSAPSTVYSSPWLDSQPYCTVIGTPGCHKNVYWPPSVGAEYQSNLTAVDQTANNSQIQTYLNNIQAINAQYLPFINVAYPDDIIGYNTQHFTNWPTFPNLMIIPPEATNVTMLATLQSAGTTSSASSSSIAPSTATTSGEGQSAMTTIVTSTVVSTASGSSVSTFYLAAIVVVIVVVAAAVAAYLARRKR